MAAHTEILMSNISAKIYEENPFRVLNLPVGARLEEAEKKAQKLITAKRLNILLPEHRSLPIPGLNGEMDEFAIQRAIDEIRNPHKRLLYELFWFHLEPDGKEAKPEIIDSLLKGEFTKAEDLWRSLSEETDPHLSLWATHNLAVLYHSKAIGNEIKNNKITEELAEHWQVALRYWHKVWAQERFWDYFKKRVLELDDARLKVQDIEILRDKLPSILKINTNFALKYFGSGKREYGLRHLELVKESAYQKAYVKEILNELNAFVSENLINICSDTGNQLTDIDNNPKAASNLHGIYADFLSRAERELKTIKAFSENVPLGDLEERIAKTLRRIGNSYRFHLCDCKKAQEILNQALKYAHSDMLKDEIKTDIKAAREDIFASVKVGKDFNPSACWFCGSELKPEEKVSSSITLKMHKVLNVKTVWTGSNTYQNHYTWRPFTVIIPRCKNCRQYHDITKRWAIGLGIFGIFFYVVGAIPMAALGYIIGHLVAAKKQKSVNYDIYAISTLGIAMLGILSILTGAWRYAILLMGIIGYLLYNFTAAKQRKEKGKLSLYALILIGGLGLISISRFGIQILLPAVLGAIAAHFIALKRQKKAKKPVKVSIRPKPYLSFNFYPHLMAARKNGYVSGEKPVGVS